MKTFHLFMRVFLNGIAVLPQEKPDFLIIQCDHSTQRIVGTYGDTKGCTLPIDGVSVAAIAA